MPSYQAIDNEMIMTVVIVIAVLALVARILINRQQKGGINWLKLGSVVGLGIVFVVTLLAVDPYRLETAFLGKVDLADPSQTHFVGREAPDEFLPLQTLSSGVIPLHFVLNADSIVPTGYWLLRDADKADASNATVREIMVSQSDTSRHAIKRTTSLFRITRNPTNESDYVPICRISIASGEKALITLPDYDIRSGRTHILTSIALQGKMQQIAQADSTLNQMVYLSGFDSAHYTSSTIMFLFYRALMATIVAAIVGMLGFVVIRFLRKS